jgi:hypothetical protein
MEHLDEHEHAFVDSNGLVIGIATFDESAHDSDWIDTFAIEHGHEKVVCCCTYGKPYIGDTWDEKNKKWIENMDVRFPKDEPTIILNAPKEINSPKA